MRIQPIKMTNAAFGFAALFVLAVAGCSALLPFEDKNGREHCGNGTVDFDEECDGQDLDNWTCVGLDLGPGELRCDSDCWLDVRQCRDPLDCGNGICHGPMEDEGTCWDDCQGMPNCGDHECQYDEEDIQRCPADCWCGNYTCDPQENGANCDEDCKEEDCADGTDNDQDNNTDCADPDCADDPACNLPCKELLDCMETCGANLQCRGECVATGCGNAQGSANSLLACMETHCGGQCADITTLGCHTCLGANCRQQVLDCYATSCSPEFHCADGEDNDGNLSIDCADPGCADIFVCQPEICNDQEDNDGDMEADCTDTDCFYHVDCASCNDARCQQIDYDTPCLGDCVAASVSAGGQHTCAALVDGTVWCWGSNSHGQLGQDPAVLTSSPAPVRVQGLFDAGFVTSGEHHTCAGRPGGVVVCWGWNEDGQLGDGTFVDSPVPVEVALPGSMSVLGAGARHTCAVAGTAKNVYCWGSNDNGRLGINQSGGRYNTPQQAGTLANVDWVVAGGAHTCAKMPDGTMWCWGLGTDGQLGTGDNNSSNIPVQPNTGNAGFTTAGGGHTCALSTNTFYARCWGLNNEGQLGNGDTVDASSPVVLTGFPWRRIEAGYRHTCATTFASPHAPRCWGSNVDGQIGNGGGSNVYLTPEPVMNLADVSDISAGGNADGSHTCAIDQNGTIHCWGDNQAGQVSGAGPMIETPRMVSIWGP